MDASVAPMGARGCPRSLSGQVVHAQTARLLFGGDEHVRIGRYRLERVIGRGGMGEVFVAHDPDLNREVALKVLRTAPGRVDEVSRLRLLREAQVMARLKHPNVVTVYDVGTHEGQVYVAMELVDGGTLRDWYEHHDRAVQETIAMFAGAGEGLSAAHRAGIVHRDFKPENVLVGDGRPQVVDFGIARAADEVVESDPSASDSSLLLAPLTAGVMGTPAFMSPEQFAGHKSDARSDQFSFCASLWGALYGEPPFDGDRLEVLCDNVLQGRRRSAPRRPRVPTRVRAALERGLSRSPEDRFATMDELLAELRLEPRRRWMTLAATGLLGVAVGSAALLMRREGPDLCRDGRERMNVAWSDERRTSLQGALGPEQATVLPALDAYVWQWESALTRACEGPDVRRYSKLSCLEWRLVELATVVDVVGRGATRPDATWQIHDVLSPAGRCLDPEHLRATPAPPEDPRIRTRVQQLRLELAAVRVRRDVDAVEQTAVLAQRAQQVGYAPLEAEARLVEGEQLAILQRPDAAIAALERAAGLGRRSHPEVEARAYVQLVYVSSFSRKYREQVTYYANQATHALERIGDRPRLSAELNLRLTRALQMFADPEVLEQARASSKAATEYFEEIGKPSAMAHVWYGLPLNSLGYHAEANVQCRRALQLSRETDPDRRIVVGVAGLVASIQGHDTQARTLLEQCIAPPVGGKPAQPLEIGACSSWLANAVRRLGDPEQALLHHDRALDLLPGLLGPDHPLVARALFHRGETHFVLGRHDDAEADYDAAEKIWASLDHEHPELLVPRVGRARAMIARGDFEGARAYLEATVVPLLPTRDFGQSTDAQAYLALAQVYARLGHPEQARTHARRASEAYAGLGPGFADEAQQARALENLQEGSDDTQR